MKGSLNRSNLSDSKSLFVFDLLPKITIKIFPPIMKAVAMREDFVIFFSVDKICEN